MGTSISRFVSTKFNGNDESLMSLVLSKMEEGEGSRKAPAKRKSSMHSIKFILCLLPLLAVPILLRTETSPFDSSSSSGTVPDGCQGPNQSEIIDIQTARLRNSVTFLPLKELRFAETAMTGNTWFMSSLNDTHEKDEAEYLYFPSQASKGRLLCTDIVASPHGAQLTNLMFMDRDSSIMEFFPKGWLELAGVGQYVFRWMADSSGMKHRGAWWDRHSEKQCPFPPKDSRCFRFYKDDKVGHNSTFFAEWTRTVLNQVRTSKSKQAPKSAPLESSACAC